MASDKTKYHGVRDKTTEMLQEELDNLGANVLVTGKYKKALVPITCICKVCDYNWEARPNGLLRGRFCPRCSNRPRYTTDSLQEKLDSMGKTLVLVGDIKTLKDPLQVSCKVCGDSWESIGLYVTANGCSNCNKKKQWTPERLEEHLLSERRDIKLISPNFTNVHATVRFSCNVCDYTWETSVSNILRGTGCSNCAKTGFKFLLPANLYYIRITKDDESLYKIGISCKPTFRRYSCETKVKIELLYEFKFEQGRTAYEAEQSILKNYKDFLFKGEAVLNFTGNSEIFHTDVLQLGHLPPIQVREYAK